MVFLRLLIIINLKNNLEKIKKTLETPKASNPSKDNSEITNTTTTPQRQPIKFIS
uniref:Candidate secreted effector n=1 Tax=Meloidogyne incognita TaxID=6306 RepID=A0A914LL96_MELIC